MGLPTWVIFAVSAVFVLIVVCLLRRFWRCIRRCRNLPPDPETPLQNRGRPKDRQYKVQFALRRSSSRSTQGTHGTPPQQDDRAALSDAPAVVDPAVPRGRVHYDRSGSIMSSNTVIDDYGVPIEPAVTRVYVQEEDTSAKDPGQLPNAYLYSSPRSVHSEGDVSPRARTDGGNHGSFYGSHAGSNATLAATQTTVSLNKTGSQGELGMPSPTHSGTGRKPRGPAGGSLRTEASLKRGGSHGVWVDKVPSPRTAPQIAIPNPPQTSSNGAYSYLYPQDRGNAPSLPGR
eukprot:TRINITY_DN5046_c0_g1_i1.p1 TRINITY_DN5046_c0_g1~~TRINITY_DN5046_c0_g1_i1.p1  ORF type:complete len:303 (+),score=13.05 TRINITY_DN5046_c0_g1_i1:48-911(+)